MHDLAGGLLFSPTPGVALIVGGLLTLLVPGSGKAALRKAVMILGPVGALVWVAVKGPETESLSFMFGTIFAIIAGIGALYNLHVKDRFEIAAEMAYAGSSLGVVYASGWLEMLVYWELMAVCSWLIVRCGRTQKASQAGFRYLLIHMLGGNLLLAGVTLKLLAGETIITCLTGNVDGAYWLILAGVAVNAAIPPLNGWIADAYPESTMGGTVYMGSYTTKVGVFCLIRLFAGTELLLYFGVFMAVWGACMALIENDLRRLFAYHIISQVGYMIAALAVGGPVGVDGAAAHAFNNILYKGTLLMCAGTVIFVTGRRKISELGGLGKKMPLTAGCFLIASLAIAGFPLLNGFNSKALVMNAVAESGNHWAELLLMVASVGTLFSVTLKLNYFVFFGPCEAAVEEANRQVSEREVPLGRKAAMVLGASGCVVCGLLPQLVYGLTPYGSDGHPFTVDHVTQYLELFGGGALAFLMYLEHMRPKKKLTLDTDWFYRKPLKYGVLGISRGCWQLFCSIGEGVYGLVTSGSRYLHHPRLLLEEKLGVKPRKRPDCLEDDDVLQKPAGWLVAMNFAIFLALILFVFYNR
ncbi:MAG: Na+/H+ antiporter subunit D [Firmicutes bacterium]|nr:Na+/H+ antiporter subunit D [Bacillota bacterium]